VITDSTPAVVPFYRNGQQVLLNYKNNPFTFTTTGFTAPDPIDPGAGTAGAVLDFTSALGYPDTLSYTASPLPLLSLSAVLYDFQVVNTDDNAPHNVSFLDPHNSTIICAGGSCTKACEGETKVEKATSGGTASVATYRASINVDSTGAVYVGMDSAPAAGTSVQVFPVLRGYVEPIKHLFGR